MKTQYGLGEVFGRTIKAVYIEAVDVFVYIGADEQGRCRVGWQ